MLPALRSQREILDEIRNDPELLERLKITSEELEALSRCVMCGALTCKDDMLFILHQIREATSPSTTSLPLASERAAHNEEAGLPIRDLRQLLLGTAPTVNSAPGSADGMRRRNVGQRFGLLLLVLLAAASLRWSGLIEMSRWRESFLRSTRAAASHARSRCAGLAISTGSVVCWSHWRPCP